MLNGKKKFAYSPPRQRKITTKGCKLRLKHPSTRKLWRLAVIILKLKKT